MASTILVHDKGTEQIRATSNEIYRSLSPQVRELVDSAMLLASHLGHLCLLSLSLLGLALIYINMLVWIAFLWLQTKLLLAMAFTLRVAYEDPKCNSTEFVDQTPISPLPKQQPQDRKDPSQHVSSTIGDTKDAHEAAQAGVTPVGLTLRNASSQHVSSTIGDPKDAPEAAQAGVTPVHHLKPVEPTRQADPKNKQPPQTEPVAKTRSVKPVQRSKEEQRGHDASQKQTAWLQSLKTKPEDTRNADSTSNAESNYSRSFNEQESRNLPRLRGTPEQLQASTLDLAVSEARQCLPQTKQGGKRMPYTTVPIQSNAARLGRQDPPSKALPRSDRYGFRTERTGLAASGNTGERVSFEDILKMDKSEVYNKVNVVSRPAHVRSPQHKTASELGEIPAEITELLAASESFEAPNSRSDDWQSAAPSEVSPERKKPAASTTSPMWSDATAIERPRQDSPPRSIGPHKPLPTEGKIVNGTQPLPTCDTSARVGNIPADTEKLPETQPRTDPTPPENMGAEVEEALPTSSPTPTHNPTVAAESYPWNNPSSDDDSDVESIGTHDESSHSSQRSSESKRASLKPNSGMGDLRQRLALLKKR